MSFVKHVDKDLYLDHCSTGCVYLNIRKPANESVLGQGYG